MYSLILGEEVVMYSLILGEEVVMYSLILGEEVVMYSVCHKGPSAASVAPGSLPPENQHGVWKEPNSLIVRQEVGLYSLTL